MYRASRTPHGVRGLKFSSSPPAVSAPPRRTPHGVRGLKSLHAAFAGLIHRRTPHGVRGLKSNGGGLIPLLIFVAPLTGCVD